MSMINLIVNYAGKFVKKVFRVYSGGFKYALPSDGDLLCVRTIREDFPEMFRYHDCKVYYKLDGNSFFNGLKQVVDDNDIRELIALASKRDDRSVDLYVDHQLPKNHPDYHTNQEMVKNMERLEDIIARENEAKKAAAESDAANNKDDEFESEKESSGGKVDTSESENESSESKEDEQIKLEKEGGRGKGDSYEKKRRDRIKENQQRMRAPGITSRSEKATKEQPNNKSQPIRRSLRFTAKETYHHETLENGATDDSHVKRVRRSLRNIGADDVQKNQALENVGSQNLEASSIVGGDIADVKNKVGGITRGVSLARKRKLGERLDIVIPEDRERIVGKNATDLITEAGIVVRQHAPLLKETWKNFKPEARQSVWEILRIDIDTKERPKMSKLWAKTHWSKRKDDWVNEKEKAIHDEAAATIKALQGDGAEVDEDEVYTKLFGEKGSYIRGCGYGPKCGSTLGAKQLLEEREKELVAVREKAQLEIDAARLEAEQARKETEAWLSCRRYVVLTVRYRRGSGLSSC